jgi:hypothetical protein
VLLVAGIAASLGCGDGIGRPLVESELDTPGAGSGGTTGGAAGSSRGGYPGFGGRGAAFGGTGSSGDGRGAGGWGGTSPGEPCAGAEDWPAELAYAELGLLDSLNLLRGIGFDCGTGTETPVPEVVMNAELQCAARRHARDMAERAFFAHENPDGLGPEDRMREAGFVVMGPTAESIARDLGDAESTAAYRAIADLLASGGTECENLVDPRFNVVGIGHFADLWTVDLAGVADR